MKPTDLLNPTEADRLTAFKYWLALNCRDDVDESEAEPTVDGNTVKDADGFTCWVLTRKEVKDAGLWTDDLDTFRLEGCEWVILPL